MVLSFYGLLAIVMLVIARWWWWWCSFQGIKLTNLRSQLHRQRNPGTLEEGIGKMITRGLWWVKTTAEPPWVSSSGSTYGWCWQGHQDGVSRWWCLTESMNRDLKRLRSADACHNFVKFPSWIVSDVFMPWVSESKPICHANRYAPSSPSGVRWVTLRCSNEDRSSEWLQENAKLEGQEANLPLFLFGTPAGHISSRFNAMKWRSVTLAYILALARLHWAYWLSSVSHYITLLLQLPMALYYSLLLSCKALSHLWPLSSGSQPPNAILRANRELGSRWGWLMPLQVLDWKPSWTLLCLVRKVQREQNIIRKLIQQCNLSFCLQQQHFL